MSADTAPAAMPGEIELANEIEREMMAWRGANGGIYTIRACAFAIAQKASGLFAPILAEKERAERTIAARDRRIARLVWAMDYARSKGIVFPADTEPKVVLSDAAAIRAQGE